MLVIETFERRRQSSTPPTPIACPGPASHKSRIQPLGKPSCLPRSGIPTIVAQYHRLATCYRADIATTSER